MAPIVQRPKALTKILVQDPTDSASVADALHRMQDQLLAQLNPTLKNPVVIPSAVALQAATPGTQQTGHSNISGTALSGKVAAGTGATGTNATLDVQATNVIVQARDSLAAIVTGANNGGALYFGVDNGGSAVVPTAAIEASWGGAANPQIGIGVIRDALRANILMEYAGNISFRFGTTVRMLIDSAGKLTTAVASPGGLTQEAWTAPTLAGAWVNFGGVYLAAGYFKDSNGVVRLRGMVKSGVVGTNIFVLPAGYRPSASLRIPVDSNSAYGLVTVDSSGNVVSVIGNNAWFDLGTVSFDTRA